MPDVFTKAKRSFVMSRIRSRGNKKTELALMEVLREQGISGWRRHVEVRSSESGVRSSKEPQHEVGEESGSVVREEAVAYGSKGKGGGETEASSRRPIRASKRKGWGDAAAGSGRKGVRASSPRLLQASFKVRPDFVFRERRVAVFVDGCFWHGCPKCYIRPGQNRKFWDAKYAANRERDRKVNRALKAAGWQVLRLWEHELARKRRGVLLRKLERVLGA